MPRLTRRVILPMCTKMITLFVVTAMFTFYSIVKAEESIPIPTKLKATLEKPGSTVATEIELGVISTLKAEMVVSEVSVKTGNGIVIKGIKIHLLNANGSAVIFLGSERVPLLLKELEEIGNCEQYSACDGYFGIARCRPSQPEPQAYCLENFHINKSDFGTLVRTPTGWFKLNQVLPTALINVVSRYGKSNDDK